MVRELLKTQTFSTQSDTPFRATQAEYNMLAFRDAELLTAAALNRINIVSRGLHAWAGQCMAEKCMLEPYIQDCMHACMHG